jgi:signal transduction histidine kinase
VIADRRYEGVAEIEVPSFVNLIVFEFHGISFKTRPEQMVYRYRLKGHEEAWRNTRERRVEYQDLPAGTYRFEVLAVDRDLVYSERPATVQLTIVQDPRDRQIDELEQRVRERTWELQEANKALSDANRALFEANVRIQEATQRKSRFLASMSHELRTPMNAIMGFTNLVLRRRSENLTERQRDNLVKVRQSADDLLDLINDLLDLSKIEAGRMEVRKVRFEVRGLIASCCETVGLLVKPGVSLVSEIADDVGTAETDEAKVRQIIINLLSNALKFTEKGEVKVRVASLRSRVESRGFSPELATRDQGPGAEGDRVMEIAVSDTGIGIPAEAMDCIFEEFRQVEGESRREKGTGLGLSITKKLTELLGGTIGVESEAGKGSTFTVRLPITYRAT